MRFDFMRYQPVYEEPGEGGGGGEPTPPPAPDPNTTPWGGVDDVWKIGEGDTAQPWYSYITDDKAREHVEAKGYKNPHELALANYSLSKMQRTPENAVVIPGEHATDQERATFYEKLGVPKEATGYDLKFGDDVIIDESTRDFGVKAFHEANLMPEQAQMLAGKWNEFVAQEQEKYVAQAAEQNEKEVEALEAQYGEELKPNMAAGQRAVQALGLSDDALKKIEGAIGGAALMDLMVRIGKKSGEGTLVDGGSGDPNDPSGMTRQQAQQEVDRLMNDESFMKVYTDKAAEGHKAAVEKMMKLQQRTVSA